MIRATRKEPRRLPQVKSDRPRLYSTKRFAQFPLAVYHESPLILEASMAKKVEQLKKQLAKTTERLKKALQ